MAVIHDDECRVGELLHATPLRPGEYIWGKFLAVLASVVRRPGAPPRGDDRVQPRDRPRASRRSSAGRSHLANYLRPALLFALPTVVFFAGVVVRGGRADAAADPGLLPAGGGAARAASSSSGTGRPSWLDPRVDRFLMLIDPAGFRWLNETLPEGRPRGERSTTRRRSRSTALIVANRLIFLAIGLGAVALEPAALRGDAPGRLATGRAGLEGGRRGERRTSWSRSRSPTSAAPPRPTAGGPGDDLAAARPDLGAPGP